MSQIELKESENNQTLVDKSIPIFRETEQRIIYHHQSFPTILAKQSLIVPCLHTSKRGKIHTFWGGELQSFFWLKGKK